MSKSKLVDVTILSPNNSGARTHSIDRITPHCMAGHATVEGCGSWFAKKTTRASSNYGIDDNGKVGLYVPEDKISWCSSSRENDTRAVTIECASDPTAPYKMNKKVYNTLVKLCVDICKRNGKKKLIWFSSKHIALNYKPKKTEMVLTIHAWFAEKSCPGKWLRNRLDELADDVNKKLNK